MKGNLFGVPILVSVLRTLRYRPWCAAFGVVVLVGISLAVHQGSRQFRARAHRASALQALDKWDFAQARSDLEYCVDVWPNDGETRYLAAQAARRGGFLDEADAHLEQAERAGYREDRILLEWALLRAQRGEVADVEETLLRRVAQDDLESPLILEGLALGYVHVYQLPKAGRCLDRLLQLQPDNVFALLWRAHCLEGIGVQDKALADYRKAIEIDPNYDEARLRLADRLAVRMKRYPEAIEQFEILRRRQPDNPRIAVGLARCRRLTGETENARQMLDDVLRAHPDDLEALGERGQLALDGDQPAEAVVYLRAAVAVPTPDRHILHALFRALQRLGSSQEAAAVLARGQRMDEDLKQMSDLLKEIGAHSRDASLYCRAAEICLRNGQDGEALRWLGGALTHDPGYGPAHAALAVYYERQGNTDLAQQHRRLAARGSDPTATAVRGRELRR